MGTLDIVHVRLPVAIQPSEECVYSAASIFTVPIVLTFDPKAMQKRCHTKINHLADDLELPSYMFMCRILHLTIGNL